MYPQVKNIEFIKWADEYISTNSTTNATIFQNEICRDKSQRRLSKLEEKDATKAFYYVQRKRSEGTDRFEWVVGSTYVYDRTTCLSPINHSVNDNKRLLDISVNDEEPKSKRRKVEKKVDDFFFLPSESLKNELANKIHFEQSLLEEIKTIIDKEPGTKSRIVVTGSEKCGKSTFIKYVASELRMHYVTVSKNWYTNIDHNFEQHLNQLGEEHGDLLVHFNFCLVSQKVKDSFAFEPIRNMCDSFKCALVYECGDPSGIRKKSDGIVELPASYAVDRERFLAHFLADSTLEPNLSLELMARETPGFSLGEIKELCHRLKTNSHSGDGQGVITLSHFSHLVLHGIVKQPAISRERVTWDDIGGHEDVKKQLISVTRSLTSPSSRATSQYKPDGIIMYGPPGCGKTMLAKALSNELNFSFISLSCSDILSKYQGDSEKNVTNAFSRARNSQPAILFMDELDAVCSRRDQDNSGSKNTIVNTLLTEMDGMDSHLNSRVFVIGATNLMDQIDPAIKRSKRLGHHIEVTVPPTAESRLDVLRKAAKHPSSPKFEYGPDETPEHEIFQELCKDCHTKNWSHSDLASLITSAFVAKMNSKDPSLTNRDHFLKAFREKRVDKTEKYQFSKAFLSNTKSIMRDSCYDNLDSFCPFNEELLGAVDAELGSGRTFITIGGPELSGKSALIATVARKHKHNLVLFDSDYFHKFNVRQFGEEVNAFVMENGPTVFQVDRMHLSQYDYRAMKKFFICNAYQETIPGVVLFFKTRGEHASNFTIPELSETERWKLLEWACGNSTVEAGIDQVGFFSRSRSWTYPDFKHLQILLRDINHITESDLVHKMRIVID